MTWLSSLLDAWLWAALAGIAAYACCLIALLWLVTRWSIRHHPTRQPDPHHSDTP